MDNFTDGSELVDAIAQIGTVKFCKDEPVFLEECYDLPDRSRSIVPHHLSGYRNAHTTMLDDTHVLKVLIAIHPCLRKKN
jgi:hypothetical protein